MTEANIKRYSMAEIKAMVDAGHFYPPAADAPEFDLDDDFWKNAKRVDAETAVVELRLNTSVLDRYRQQGPDHLARMAKVLEDHLSKKAS